MLMMHAKFQGNRTYGSGEEYFRTSRFLQGMGGEAILAMSSGPFIPTSPPSHGSFTGFNWPSSLGKEDL